MNLKSRPSAAAFVIKITFTFSPYLLSESVTYFKSSKLLGEYFLSPVIITYFACLNFSSPSSISSFVFIVNASIGFASQSLNNGFV